MLKKIISLLLIAGIFTLTGCWPEDDDSESRSSGIDMDKVSRVTGVNDAHEQPGDLRVYTTENGWDVIATEKTTIQRQRPSCSGFETGDIWGVAPRTTIGWEYNNSQAIYAEKKVRPSLIQIYRDECINAANDPTIIICCPTNNP